MTFKIKLLFFLLPFGCNNTNSNQNSEEQISKLESFDEFYHKFYSDSTFQRNRITFPLINLLWDVDKKSYDKEIINANEWEFTSLDDNKYLKKITKSEFRVKLNIQIQDTGVSVNYIFNLKNGKWFLDKIIDEST
jgi:hypothetical protein